MTRPSSVPSAHPPRRSSGSAAVIVWLAGFWLAIFAGIALWVML